MSITNNESKKLLYSTQKKIVIVLCNISSQFMKVTLNILYTYLFHWKIQNPEFD